MRKKIKQYLLPGAIFVLNLLAALFWVALRVNYSGISKFLGADTNPSFLVMNLPVMVCVLAWIACAGALAGMLLWHKKKWVSVTSLVLGVIVTVGAVVVVIFGAKDYLRFIMVHFWESLAVTAGILAFAAALLFPVKNSRKTLAVKAAVLLIVVLGAVIIGYQLRPCTITHGAVVYAVEDDYQIVFTTSDSAIAWVEVDGQCYYDLYAGSMRSADRIHKITLPQNVLDAAGAYSIHAKQMIYRGPFGGYTGQTISQSYPFRPVDTSDGLDYFALSDVHEAVDAAVAAATTENIDFLVLLGDLVSMVETEADCQIANELAFGITGGQIPVIYARGNHEIKGEYGELLYKYVGSKNQEFYYYVTLGSEVFAVVADIGEDHDDAWWEYYGTARFQQYRDVQTAYYEELLDSGIWKEYDYRMAISHIPFSYVGSKGYFEADCNRWTEIFNEMGMDMGLSGHKHVMWALLPEHTPESSPMPYSVAFKGAEGKTDKGYITDIAFPCFLVGRRSDSFTGGTQGDGYDQYSCLFTHADLTAGEQVSRYINARGQTLEGAYPFYEETYSQVKTQLRS